MKLNKSQIEKVTLGAVRVTEEADGFHFYRFSQEQEKLYEGRNPDFDKKVLSTTGVQLAFRTDSRELYLKIDVKPGANRTYFALEIFVDDKKVDTIANFKNFRELSGTNYTTMNFPLGVFEKRISLGVGEKTVRIVLPWSMQTVIKEIALPVGATLEPVKPSKKWLIFGDSITQGYDALYPSNKYISHLANHFGAEEYNKAIGGEVFFPELAETKEPFTPDQILVAYGTNDWNLAKTKELFLQRCKDFFRNLTNTYPHTPILVITPTWRGEWQEMRPAGAFTDVDGLIRGVAEQYKNVTVVSGMDFIEHDIKYFADRRIHPNDEGFDQYCKNLMKVFPFVHS